MKLALILIVGTIVYIVVAIAVEKYVSSQNWFFVGAMFGIFLALVVDILLKYY